MFQNGNLRVKRQEGIASKSPSFVVKIQPCSRMHEAGTEFAFDNALPLSVYNEDRSVLGEIRSTDSAYAPLKEAVIKNGCSKVKAYFRVMKTPSGYKVNPGRMVEIQPW